MKLGDKLYCKKALYCGYGKGFAVDNIYHIVDIDTDRDFVTVSEYSGHLQYKFDINKKDLYVYDYFLTEKEVRKLKLDAIEK